MTKLEEILNTFPSQKFDRERVKEIAIAYAKICLEKAAEKATFIMTIQSIKKDGFIEGYSKVPAINKASITNIELP